MTKKWQVRVWTPGTGCPIAEDATSHEIECMDPASPHGPTARTIGPVPRGWHELYRNGNGTRIVGCNEPCTKCPLREVPYSVRRVRAAPGRVTYETDLADTHPFLPTLRALHANGQSTIIIRSTHT